MEARLYLKADAVKYGWEKVSNNIPFFVLVTLTVLVVNFLPRISDSIWGPSAILGFVFFLIKTFIDIGMIRIALNFVDGLSSKYETLFSGMPLFLKYLAAVIIFIVLVGVGLVLLVVPGIIVGVRLMFFGPLIVDKGLEPIDAIKKSFEMTKGKTWDLFLFTLIVFGLNILGLLCLGVGLLLTLPLTSIATMDIYRKINSAAGIAASNE